VKYYFGEFYETAMIVQFWLKANPHNAHFTW